MSWPGLNRKKRKPQKLKKKRGSKEIRGLSSDPWETEVKLNSWKKIDTALLAKHAPEGGCLKKKWKKEKRKGNREPELMVCITGEKKSGGERPSPQTKKTKGK